MRTLLAVFILALLLVVPAFASDDHANAAEKRATDSITITQPVKIANQTLPAGRYTLTCDKENLTFQSEKGEKFTFPCQGKELPKKVAGTELHMRMDGGDRVVTRLLLRGSNIEHTF